MFIVLLFYCIGVWSCFAVCPFHHPVCCEGLVVCPVSLGRGSVARGSLGESNLGVWDECPLPPPQYTNPKIPKLQNLQNEHKIWSMHFIHITKQTFDGVYLYSFQKLQKKLNTNYGTQNWSCWFLFLGSIFSYFVV